MKGIHVAFVVGKTGPKEIRMSCRSDGYLNVQLLAEKLGGGGHFTAAAATFKHNDLEKVEKELHDVLRKYSSEAKADSKMR
jgi:c-di-AMP phosphodiesterase-like protein